MTKTKITNPTQEPALFLGTHLSTSDHEGSYIGKNHQRLRAISQLRMLVPLERVYNKLTNAGFISAKYRTGTPKFNWLSNDKDTIIKLYNSVLRGYLNYYSFAHNYNHLATSLE
jgi:hypothetical protein